MIRIALFAALPQEYGYLKKLAGTWRRVSRNPFRRFSWSMRDREVLLIETGMGRSMVEGALKWLLKDSLPDLIVSFGFAGSLDENLPVGRVILGNSFLLHDPSGPVKETCHLDASPGLERFCGFHDVGRSRIVTTAKPLPKALAGKLLGSTSTLLDMESYHVARFALEEGISFLGFRAVSDGPSDEIDFDLDAITNDRGRVSIPGVLRSVAKRPELISSLHASWKRSNVAALRLGEVLAAFTALPGDELRELLIADRLWLEGGGRLGAN